MKWIGQHIWDLASRFRDDVYFEDLAETTETRGLVVNADGKLSINPLSGDEHATHVYENVRNDEGSTIPVGTPVYSKGEVGGSERILVGIAKANDPTKMPAIGITNTELTTTGDTKDGLTTLVGIYNTNISGFSGLSVNSIVYVASTGGLTITKPTGVNLIQNVGVILKTNGSIIQGLQVTCVGRTNDVPTPLYIDHTNQRLGIGITAPTQALHLPDSKQIALGTGADLKIQHNGTNSEIGNFTGSLNIYNHADNSDINFMADDGSGGIATYFFLDGSATNMKAYKDMRFIDNVDAEFGDGGDFKIYHDGSNTYLEQINAGTGNIVISNANDDADIIFKSDDGSGGVTPYLTLDGGLGYTTAQKQIRFADSVEAQFGGIADLTISHDATNSIIANNTGDLQIKNRADDKDIIFETDDGSGGTTAYLTLDGSTTQTLVHKDLRFDDNIGAVFGSGAALKLHSDGSNGIIDNFQGNLIIRQQVDNADIIFQSDDGSGGVETYFYLDGSANVDGNPRTKFPDGSRLIFGDGDDVEIYHNSVDSWLRNNTGDLKIVNYADDKDIILYSDDGSGGVTAYLTLDGSAGTVEVAKEMNLAVPLATDHQKHLANFEFEGFSVGDGANYMIAELNSDTKAPFEHQTSTGSDGLTATGPVRLMKTAGHVMPYAGTLRLWKGWATSSGTGQSVDIGLYKVTLENNDATDVSPVVLKNTRFTSVGNTKALTFAETSFSVAFAAGDILVSAIKNGTDTKRCDFSSMLVVEWD
jgi:hypothetical protein